MQHLLRLEVGLRDLPKCDHLCHVTPLHRLTPEDKSLVIITAAEPTPLNSSADLDSTPTSGLDYSAQLCKHSMGFEDFQACTPPLDPLS